MDTKNPIEELRRLRERRKASATMRNFMLCAIGANIVTPPALLEEIEEKVTNNVLLQTALTNCMEHVELLTPKQLILVLLLVAAKKLKQVDLLDMSGKLDDINNAALMYLAEHPEVRASEEAAKEDVEGLLKNGALI